MVVDVELYYWGNWWKLSSKSRKNEMNRALGHLCAHIEAKLGQENLLRMVRWMRWHCPPDTGFEIRALAVWGRAGYFSVTEAPHNTGFFTWMHLHLSSCLLPADSLIDITYVLGVQNPPFSCPTPAGQTIWPECDLHTTVSKPVTS